MLQDLGNLTKHCNKGNLSKENLWKSYKELHFVEYLRLMKLKNLQAAKIRRKSTILKLSIQVVLDETVLEKTFQNSKLTADIHLNLLFTSLNKRLGSDSLVIRNWNTTIASLPLLSMSSLSPPLSSSPPSSPPPPPSSSSSSCRDILRLLLRYRLQEWLGGKCHDPSHVWVFMGFSPWKCSRARPVPDSACSNRAVIYLPIGDTDNYNTSSLTPDLYFALLRVLGLSTIESKAERNLLWCLESVGRMVDEEEDDGGEYEDEEDGKSNYMILKLFQSEPPFSQTCGNGVVERGEQCDCGGDDDDDDDGGDDDDDESDGCCDEETCLFVSCSRIQECCRHCGIEGDKFLHHHHSHHHSLHPHHHRVAFCLCEGITVAKERCSCHKSNLNRSLSLDTIGYDGQNIDHSHVFVIFNSTNQNNGSDLDFRKYANDKAVGGGNDANKRRTLSKWLGDNGSVNKDTSKNLLHPPPPSFFSSSSIFILVCSLFSAAFIVYFVVYNHRIHRRSSKARWPTRFHRKRKIDGKDWLEQDNTTTHDNKSTVISFGTMPSYRNYKLQIRYGVPPLENAEGASPETLEEVKTIVVTTLRSPPESGAVPGKSILKKNSINKI